MKYIILILTSLTINLAHAETHKGWEQLLQRAANEGQVQETTFGEFRTLINTTNEDLSKPHLIQYLSVVGGSSQSNDNSTPGFYISHVELAWEDWQIDKDNHWNVNQWLFKVDIQGNPIRVWHFHIVEDIESGHIYEHEQIYASPEEQQSAWLERISFWLK